VILGPRALGLVCWDGRRVHSITNSRNDAPDDELCGGVVALEREYLDCRTDNHDCGSDDYSLSAPKRVTEYQHCNGAKKT
jgi:hypothetical protein